MAKKKYYQSPSDRLAESRGMERSLYRKKMRMLGPEYYAGMEPRRRQELEDSGMIAENHSEVANLPQGVVMRPWPKADYYSREGLDDTIRGINVQMDSDGRRMDKYGKENDEFPEMY